MFSPTQFGLALLLPAFFIDSRSPSLKLGEVSANTPCALASCTPQTAASATAPAKIEPRLNMTSLPVIIVVLIQSPIARSPSTPHPSKHSISHGEVSEIPCPAAPRKCRADAAATPASRR